MLGQGIPPVFVEFIAVYDKFTKGIDKVERDLADLERKGASFGQKFGASMKVGLGVTAGILGVFTAKAVKEAMSAEVVMLDLQNSIKTLGQSVEEVVPQVEAMSQAMVDLGFDDEDAMRAFTKLNTALKDPTKAMSAMGLVADVARKKHLDLASASTLVARATTGTARLFTEFGIKLDTSIKDPAERVNKAFAELQDRIGGTAEAFGQTATGQMQSFQQEMDNVYQEIGMAFLPIIKDTIPYLKLFAEWAKKNAGILSGVLVVAIGAVTTALTTMAIAQVAANWPIALTIALILALVAGFIYAWNASKEFRQAMIDLGKAGIDAFLFLEDAMVNFVGNYMDAIDKVLGASSALASFFGDDASAKQLDAWGDEIRQFNTNLENENNRLKKSAEDWKKSLQSMEDSTIGIDIDAMKKEVMSLASGDFIVDKVGGLDGETPTSVTKGIDKFIQRIQRYQDELGLTKEKIDGNVEAMKKVADEASRYAEKWLKQARAFEKATKNTDQHEKAVKRLSTALSFATDAQRYQNQVTAEAERQAQDTTSAITQMMNTYQRANSYLATQSRVSGYGTQNTFVEVPVMIDGQVLFRVSQKASLLNNRRNATNGLSVSNAVI